MRTVQIVLVVPQPLHRELLSRALSNEPGIHVVVEATDELEAAISLRRLFADESYAIDDTLVAIASCDDDRDGVVPPVCARLVGEFPDLVVIGIFWRSAQVNAYRQKIHVRELPSSLAGVIGQLRSAAAARR